ncbi:hypothetical protein ABW20_dc0105790 [Dactylellina cionopaga]|nr:hypothetical protein ABW20_dc0105790 [Dactylellina cionopaga]
MTSSLKRAHLQRLATPPSLWICRACQVHGSARLYAAARDTKFEQIKLDEVQFPPASKLRGKGKQLRVEASMTEEEKATVLMKKRREHHKFVKRIAEFVDAWTEQANRKKSKNAPVAARKLLRGQDILEVAREFETTPSGWPSMTKKAITWDELVAMHTACKMSLEEIKAGNDVPGRRAPGRSFMKRIGEAAAVTKENGTEPDGPVPERSFMGKGKQIRIVPIGISTAKSEKATTTAEVEVENEGEVAEDGASEDVDAEPKKKPRKSAKEKKLEVAAVTINANDFALEQQDVELRPLSHGLDRVLFNPGVTFLRDPRSKVYNFDPYLDTIMPVDEFDFNALGDYITSSKDTTLIDLAKGSGKKYVGSTSSMTSILSHLHYLLSRWRPLTLSMLSKGFVTESENFTKLSRLPVSVILRWKDGVYAIDQDKEVDGLETILLFLGRSMEKMLTMPPEVFQKYHKSASHEIPEEVRNARERYHYTSFGDLLFRSQLDAHDDRLPGTGVFDLKTRGVLSIRMNAHEPAVGWGYQIKTADGQFESFEREYYDLIRAAFMKYSLQVRMGRMDGCFVAYHNTKQIFGFQYISIDEMDEALHGGPDIGDQEFKLSLKLLNEALDRATAKYPEQSLRLWFETRESGMPFLYFAAEPLSEEELASSQDREANLDIVFEQIKRSSDRISPGSWRPYGDERPIDTEGMSAGEREIEDSEQEGFSEADVRMSPRDQAMKDILDEDRATMQKELDSLRESAEMLESVRVEGEGLIEPGDEVKPVEEEEADEEAEEAGEEIDKETEENVEEGIETTSGDEIMDGKTTAAAASTTPTDSPETKEDIFVQVLVSQNIVNGEKVDRPAKLGPKDVWSVNYAFLDMEAKAASKTIASIKKRKREGVDFDVNWKSTFMTHLLRLSKEGGQLAAEQKREDQAREVLVYRRRD